jgi:glycerol-3-phosphate dehydrogenase (NAD(P)+)
MPTRVTIIGAGEIGSAINALIKTSGAKVEEWDKDLSKVPKQKPLDVVVRSADVIFLCVPSWHARDAVAEIAPFLSKRTIVVSVSKGIELGTRFTIDELLTKALPRGQSIALLSGPMLAEELMEDLPTLAVIATTKRKTFTRVSALFKQSPLRTCWSNDLRGTALAGVLKNIYALSLGIADAIPLGSNAKGWLVQEAMEEMMGIIATLHDQKKAVAAALSPAGLGDLVATGISPYSSNFTVGRELVAGRGITKMSEGFISLPSLHDLLGKKVKTFPLFRAVSAVVMDKKSARKVFAQFVASA